MLKYRHTFAGIFLMAALGSNSLVSKDLIFIDVNGESNYLPINSSDKFDDVMEDIATYMKNSEGRSAPVAFNIVVNDKEVVVNSQKAGRDYHAKLTAKEQKDLEYIVTIIAWEKNPKKLWDHKSDLEKAKERIFHLHPFKFLEGICTNEKLCAGLKAIRERTILVWPEFVKGCITTLKIEHKLDNVLPYISEFAKVVGVDEKYLLPAARTENWEEFVKIVADKVERSNDPNRYDM